jgi:hypothetical protein
MGLLQGCRLGGDMRPRVHLKHMVRQHYFATGEETSVECLSPVIERG